MTLLPMVAEGTSRSNAVGLEFAQTTFIVAERRPNVAVGFNPRKRETVDFPSRSDG
jgi:hypothetical protein